MTTFVTLSMLPMACAHMARLWLIILGLTSGCVLWVNSLFCPAVHLSVSGAVCMYMARWMINDAVNLHCKFSQSWGFHTSTHFWGEGGGAGGIMFLVCPSICTNLINAWTPECMKGVHSFCDNELTRFWVSKVEVTTWPNMGKNSALEPQLHSYVTR